jgi:hypothetical protein
LLEVGSHDAATLVRADALAGEGLPQEPLHPIGLGDQAFHLFQLLPGKFAPAK